MKCPVNPDVDLIHVSANGIELERCPECGGLWLDRGELEKLIAIAAAEERAAGIPARKTPGDAFETPRVGGLSGTVRQFESEPPAPAGIPAKKTPGDAFETPRVGGLSGIVRQLGRQAATAVQADRPDADDEIPEYMEHEIMDGVAWEGAAGADFDPINQHLTETTDDDF